MTRKAKPENPRVDQAAEDGAETRLVLPPTDNTAAPPPVRATAADVRAFIRSLGEETAFLFR
ncbi:MAG: hypothetical protein GX616_26170 [Planctomycetes bacterium]|nr:hypothetical protein [Planctomycetota bacterium]